MEKIGNNPEIDKVNQFLTGKTVFKVLLFWTLYRTAPVLGDYIVSAEQNIWLINIYNFFIVTYCYWVNNKLLKNIYLEAIN